MSKHTTMRFIATNALSYCLSVFLIILITGVIVLRTVLNPLYILSRMEHSGFIEQSVIELREVFISYGLGSGVERDTMASLITEHHVVEAAEGIILQKYGRESGFSFEAYIDEMYLVFYDYAISKGFQITEDIETGLFELAELCANALSNHLDTLVISVLAQTQHYTRIILIGVLVVSVFSLGVIIIIPFVNREVTRAIDSYLYAFGAAAILCAAISIVYYSTGLSTRLQITPMSYKMLISSWLDGIINGYLIALIITISLILICVFAQLYKNKFFNRRLFSSVSGQRVIKKQNILHNIFRRD